MSEPGVNSPQTEAKGLDTKGSGPESDPLIGLLFEGRYEILALFGKGATAAAYKSRDTLLQRDVALKIIHNYLLSSPEAIQRFKNEATTSLTHQNIAQVYNQGIAADGRLYIVMDGLEGDSLPDYIARKGKLELDEFFEYFEQLIDALSYAHAQGIVHRDIKPNNIVIARDGERNKAVLVDFGVAKFLGESGDQSATRTGAMLGSSAYMSPEQCMGKSDIDERSDIYSLGCVMLETLLGKSPFEGESALDVMYKHLNASLGQLGFLKELPEALAQIISKCLEKERENRYQSMSDLKQDFSACYEMQDTLKRRWQLKKEGGARKRQIGILAPLALITMLGLAAYYSSQFFIEEQTRKNAAAKRSIGASAHKKLPPPESSKPPLKEEELSALVRRYEAEVSLDSTIIVLNKWVEHYGNAVDREELINTYALLGVYYARLDKRDKAEEYLEKVLHYGKNNAAALGAVSAVIQMYNRENMYKESLELIDRLMTKFKSIRETPDRIFHLNQLKADCYKEMREDKTAIDCLNTALQAPYAKSLSAAMLNSSRYALITLLCRSGQLHQARELANECLQTVDLEPGDKKTMLLIAQYRDLAHAFGQGDALLDSLKYSRSLRDLYIQAGTTEAAMNETHAISNVLRELGQYKLALKEETELLKQLQDPKRKAILMSQISLDLHSSGEIKQAYNMAREALVICNAELSKDLNKSAKSGTMLAQEGTFVACVCRVRDELTFQTTDLEEQKKVVNSAIERLKGYPSPLLFALYLQKACHYVQLRLPIEQIVPVLDQAKQVLLSAEYRDLIKEPQLIDEHLSQLCIVKANALDNYGMFDKALLEADQALAISKRSKPVNQHGLLRAQLHRANDFVRLGNAVEAENCYTEAERLCKALYYDYTTGNTEHWRQIANYKRSVGKYQEAESIFKRCLTGLRLRYGDKSPLLVQYYYDLAIVELNAGKIEEIAAIADKALDILNANKREPIHLYEGCLYLKYDQAIRKADWAAAEKYMKTSIAETTKSRDQREIGKSYYQLSVVYANSNQPDKRISTLEEGLAKARQLGLKVENCSFDIELAALYIDRLQFDKAKLLLAESLELSPKLTESSGSNSSAFKLAMTYSMLGKISKLEGKPAEACKYYTKAADYYERVKKEYMPNLKEALAQAIEAASACHDDKTMALLQARLKQLN